MLDVVIAGTAYAASLINCYDGDTCKIKVDSWVPFQEYSLRLEGFDTPEIRGECEYEQTLAKEAREATIAYINKHKPTFKVSGKDKYGRLLTEIEGLSEHLITTGLARPYDGGKRQPWCIDT